MAAEPAPGKPDAIAMPRIALITQFFYPENAAVAQFMTTLAVELQRRGLQITVLTSGATYNRDAGRLPRRDEYEGVKIHRLWGTHFDKRNLAGRIANLATFSLSLLVELLRIKKPDLVFISNAPLFGLVGRLANLLRGQRYVCLIQDVYPDLAVALGVFGSRSIARRVWDGINRSVYSNAAAVVTLGNRMRDVVLGRLGTKVAARVKMHVIPDWADGDAIRPIPKEENWFAREHGLLDRIVVLYSGNHGLAHDLETIIEAADRLRDDPRFLFLFIGEGGKKPLLMDMVAERRLDNVRFLPYQLVENLPLTLTCGDVSVVTMEEGVEGMVIPSKIYGALAAGQAILALVGERTEVSDIVHSSSCGYQVKPGDSESLTTTLRMIAGDPVQLTLMKKRSRNCYEQEFRLEVAAKRYYALLSSVVLEDLNVPKCFFKKERLSP